MGPERLIWAAPGPDSGTLCLMHQNFRDRPVAELGCSVILLSVFAQEEKWAALSKQMELAVAQRQSS